MSVTRRPRLGLELLLAASLVAMAGCGETAPEPDKDPPATGGMAGSAGAGGSSGGGASGSAGVVSGGAGAGGSAGSSGSAGGGTGGTAGSSGAGGDGGTAGSASGAGGSVAGVGGGGGATGGAGSAGTAGTAGSAGNAGASGDAGSSGTAGDGGTAGSGNDRPARVLLYHFSTLDIPSVPQQLDIFESKLTSWGFEVERSEDPAKFSDENLERYAAVGMINTCFFPFGANNSTGQQEAQALQGFLQDGGGLFGTHCADVTFQSAATPVLYNQLLGGRASSQYFEGMSQCSTQGEHATISALPPTFTYDGNLDNTNFIADDTEVLVRCKWGDAANTDVAVSWVRTEGSGRVFFTGFGKVAADLTNATIGDNHIVAGLAWVLWRSP